MRKAGIRKKGAVHILRHSKATELAGRGLSPYEIARYLDHSDIQTSMIYVHLVAEDLKKSIPKLPY